MLLTLFFMNILTFKTLEGHSKYDEYHNMPQTTKCSNRFHLSCLLQMFLITVRLEYNGTTTVYSLRGFVDYSPWTESIDNNCHRVYTALTFGPPATQG